MKILITILFLFPLFINAQTKIFAINKPVTYPDPPADTTPPPAGRQHILWESTFEETGPFDVYYPLDAASPNLSYSINLKTDTVYRGGHSVRFMLFKTDPVVGAGTRSELTPRYLDPGPFSETWMGFASFFPTPGYDNDVTGQDLFNQVHANNGESPPFGIVTLNGQIYIDHNSGLSSSPTYAISATGVSYPKNQWVRWVWHNRFYNDGTGFCEVWMNDVLIFNYTGNMQYSDVTGDNFYRIGIYKWPWSQGTSSSVTFREILFDDIRIGSAQATYNDVVPRTTD